MCSPFAGRVSWYMLNWFICSQFFSSFWFAQFLGAIHEKVQHHHHLDVSGLINPRLIGGDTILGDQHQLQTSSRIASYIPKLPWFNHCIRTSITPSMVPNMWFHPLLVTMVSGGVFNMNAGHDLFRGFHVTKLLIIWWVLISASAYVQIWSPIIYLYTLYIYDQHN